MVLLGDEPTVWRQGPPKLGGHGACGNESRASPQTDPLVVAPSGPCAGEIPGAIPGPRGLAVQAAGIDPEGMLGMRRHSNLAAVIGLSTLVATLEPAALASSGGTQFEPSESRGASSAPQATAWLWNRQVELWIGEESAAFGGVDLAFVRTELESGFQLSFAASQAQRDWSVGNPRVTEIEHDQAAQFNGLTLTLRPVDMGPHWTVDVDGPLLEGFRQNTAQAAESARVAGRFPEFARHVDLAIARRLMNAASAAQHAASWLQATRLVGPRPDLPRMGEPYWIGDPLLEREVFGAAGAWVLSAAPAGEAEAEALNRGMALESGRALLSPDSLETYVESQRAGGRTTEVGAAFDWSVGKPDEEGRRRVECRLTMQEGSQRWSLVDRFTPLPLDDPQFEAFQPAGSSKEIPTAGR